MWGGSTCNFPIFQKLHEGDLMLQNTLLRTQTMAARPKRFSLESRQGVPCAQKFLKLAWTDGRARRSPCSIAAQESREHPSLFKLALSLSRV